MSNYTVPIDILDGKFNSPYPIFLQEHGISPQQFQTTLQQCNDITQEGINKLKALTKWQGILVLMIVLIPLLPFIIGIVTTVKYTRQFSFLLIPAIALSMAILFIGLIASQYIMSKKQKKCHKEMKDNLMNYLHYQNVNVYMSNRVQLILQTYDTYNGFGVYRVTGSFGSKNRYLVQTGIPTIQILTTNTPVDIQQILDINPLQTLPPQPYMPNYSIIQNPNTFVQEQQPYYQQPYQYYAQPQQHAPVVYTSERPQQQIDPEQKLL
jgi:hypothetical protein